MAVTSITNVACFVSALLSLLFAIIVMGVISDKVSDKLESGTRYCHYELGSNSNANNFSTSVCDFGVAMGVIGMLASIVYSALSGIDMFYPVEMIATKLAYILRAAGAFFIAFLWLICFAVITENYNKNDIQDLAFVTDSVKSAMQAGVAFSFLATLAWVVIFVFTLLTVKRVDASVGTYKPHAESPAPAPAAQ